LGAQDFQCETPHPTAEEFEYLISLQPQIDQFVANRPSSFSGTIPVFFTVLRNGDGSFNTSPPVDDAVLDGLITSLNQAFSATGISFYKLGATNYIDYDVLHDNLVLRSNYVYLQDALNVYIHENGNGSFAAQPNMLNPWEMDNILQLAKSSIGSDNSTFIHEMGHSFSLLHTHGATLPYRYDFDNPQMPIPDSQADHPYNQQNPQLRRELQIRVNTMGKTFDLANCNESGDLCCDTYPNCFFGFWAGDNNPHPAFDQTNIENCLDGIPATLCATGCQATLQNNVLTYIGTYRDYNQDLITPNMTNFMSYYWFRSSFTDCQVEKMQFAYETWRKPKYDGAVINLSDKVEYKGTSVPMNSVNLRWEYLNSQRMFNATTGTNGVFQGHFYTPEVKVGVRKTGSLFSHNPNAPDLYSHADWKKDIDIQDLIRIFKHTTGPGLTLAGDGYNLIAADANHDNTLTTDDFDLFWALVKGNITSLPAFDAPWRFVPEYIPQDYPLQFHDDPFNMIFPTINAQNPVGTPYTEPSWEYEIPNDTDKRGYDGIKIGDVYGEPTPPGLCEDSPALLFSNPPLIAPNEQVDILLKSNAFANVESFQFGMFIDHEKLQVMSVSSGTLPDFSQQHNVGMSLLEDDQLNVLWFQNNTQTVSVGSQSDILKIRVKALQPITNLEEGISFGGDLPSKIFKLNGCSGTTMPIVGIVEPVTGTRPGKSRNLEGINRHKSLYCYPNPVVGALNISFEHDVAEQGTLSFFDLNGRAVFYRDVEVNQGINTISLNSGELEDLPSGVLNVTLRTGLGLLSGKLVKL